MHTELLEACGRESLPFRTELGGRAFRRGMEDVHQKTWSRQTAMSSRAVCSKISTTRRCG